MDALQQFQARTSIGSPPTSTTPTVTTPPVSSNSGITPDVIKQNVLKLQGVNATPEDIEAYVSKASQEMGQTNTSTPMASSPGFFSKIGGALTGNNPSTGGEAFVSSVPNIIGGIAKGAGQTLAGVASIPQNVANFFTGNNNSNSPLGSTISQQVSPALQPHGLSQGVGFGLEKVGELLSPTPEISAAKNVMGGLDLANAASKLPVVGETIAKGINAVKDIPGAVKAGTIALRSIPEAGFGTIYGLSQGQTPGEAAKTGVTFGALSGLGETVGNLWQAIKGGVVDNIQKAIPVLGKLTPDQAIQTVPKALNAFQTMADNAGGIIVKDVNGIEKTWEPAKDGFYEALQGFNQTKNKVYQAYTDLATQAGDKGSQMLPADFQAVQKDLTATMKDTTSGFVNKAKALIQDLQRNFGTFDEEGKFLGYKQTDLGRIQNFIQKINTDVNPLSDKAGAEISDTASKSLRGIMDGKIEKATGSSYQDIRDQYASLKSIENGLISSAKKSFNKTGGRIGQYIEGFGSLDTLLGALSHNPIEMVKGVGMATIGKTMNYLRDPEVGLQNAFQQIMDNTPSPLKNRLLGK